MTKVLLVEDEKLISEAFNIILKSADFTVDVAANGREALEFCKEQSYDIVLLDLMMPVMDGIEFLQKARDLNAKIIILSNLSSGEMVTQALKLGAHNHKLKADLTPQTLIELVRSTVAKTK